MNKNAIDTWKRILLLTPLLLPFAAPAQTGPTVTLPNHVIGILANATLLPRSPLASLDPMDVCVVLNSQDQAGLEAFEKNFNDPSSPSHHRGTKAADLTERFGPTQQSYDTVFDYLEQRGFTLVVGSANRMTITVRGTRAQVESRVQRSHQ